jgi:L-ascorbate metabolism protein UlaG (beta-lactamase superfamily)
MVAGKSVGIEWFGQAMFRISSAEGTVVVDPTPPQVGYEYEPVSADIVLITHRHFDHFYLDGIAGSPRIVNASGKFDFDGFKVVAFDSYHDAKLGEERGRNVIYTWEQAGLKFGHFGDLGHMPGHDLMKKVLKLDVAMVPVGGVFTIDDEQAVRLIRDLEARIVLPMHYGTPDCVIPLEQVDEFTRRFKGTVRQVKDRPVEITRDSVPSATEVWVLPYE